MAKTRPFGEAVSTIAEPRLEFAFEVRLRFTRVQMIEAMPSGASRGAVYLDSGEFSGPRLRGKAVPNSGGDYALFRPDDTAAFDARYMLGAGFVCAAVGTYLQARITVPTCPVAP